MATTSHPDFPNHTHKYYKPVEVPPGEIIVNADVTTFGSCPEGHADCQVTDVGYHTALVLSQWDGLTRDTVTGLTFWLTDEECIAYDIYPEYSYALGAHVHVMDFFNVEDLPGYFFQAFANLTTSCPLGHARCVKISTYKTPIVATGYYITPTELADFDAIPYIGVPDLVQNYDPTHTHYYRLPQGLFKRIGSYTECVLSHSLCKNVASTNSIPRFTGAVIDTSWDYTTGPILGAPRSQVINIP